MNSVVACHRVAAEVPHSRVSDVGLVEPHATVIDVVIPRNRAEGNATCGPSRIHDIQPVDKVFALVELDQISGEKHEIDRLRQQCSGLARSGNNVRHGNELCQV